MTYLGSEAREIDDVEILQMIGRAGRQQFDEKGLAIILTRSDKRSRYENLVLGKEPVESQLHLHLHEHMNIEIGLGTISDVQSAKNWLKTTYFYIRSQMNPAYYGLAHSGPSLDVQLERKCEVVIEDLMEASLVHVSEGKLQHTREGKAASRFCMRFKTVRGLKEIGPNPTLQKIVIVSAV